MRASLKPLQHHSVMVTRGSRGALKLALIMPRGISKLPTAEASFSNAAQKYPHIYIYRYVICIYIYINICIYVSRNSLIFLFGKMEGKRETNELEISALPSPPSPLLPPPRTFSWTAVDEPHTCILYINCIICITYTFYVCFYIIFVVIYYIIYVKEIESSAFIHALEIYQFFFQSKVI